MAEIDWRLIDQPKEVVEKKPLPAVRGIRLELTTLYLKKSDMTVYGLRAYTGDDPLAPGFWSRIIGVYDSMDDVAAWRDKQVAAVTPDRPPEE